MKTNIPSHLKPYIIKQKNSAYTFEDQAVWRFTLRQLTFFLKKQAHPFYLEGLKQTGISVETIPSISNIDLSLQKIGWQACPVSGFVPPSVFMELQAYSILPIATEIRSINNILYTPAPDIIHEAAGHTPFLAHPHYSAYLKSYASVAKKALLSLEDLNLYEKIRNLSDLKANEQSTAKQIQNAELQLETASKNISFVSEAAYLGRMNWWTAEYGLFGDINKPTILGAGLLSSILESENCLKSDIKKIPLTVDCTEYNYDITKIQPQLFVTKDFQTLEDTLTQFSKDLAYNTGGDLSIDKAKQSQLVNTIELNSGLQISGKLVNNIRDSRANLPDNKHTNIFLKWEGPTQLSYNNKELQGHNKDYHSSGYSSPLGTINKLDLAKASSEELKQLNIEEGKTISLNFDSNIKLTGTVTNLFFKDSKLLLITFENCLVKYQEQILFDPTWGKFDLAVGTKVVSVFSGPADSIAYNSNTDFQPQYIAKKQPSLEQQNRFLIYEELQQLRQLFLQKNTITQNISALFKKVQSQETHWLILLELYELSLWSKHSVQTDLLHLLNQLDLNAHDSCCLKKGLSIAQQF